MAFFGEVEVVVACGAYPFAMGGDGCALFDGVDYVGYGWGGGGCAVNGEQACGVGEDVAVCINEAGQDGFAAAMDDFGAGQGCG